MMAISLDIDWAPDAVIGEALSMLASLGITATIFATHDTPLLRESDQHEVGLHPNLVPGDRTCRETLEPLLHAYPGARGVRCHSYHQNSHVLDVFAKTGFVYDSNIVMFGHPAIFPFQHWNGLVRLPVFWEDDVNCIVRGSWVPGDLDMSRDDAMFVFDFHPVHLFLNTECIQRYEAAKPFYQNARELRRHVNPESSGVGTRVFLKRLVALAGGGQRFCRLDEIVKRAACQNSSRVSTSLRGSGGE